jgi:hypothetical protein
VIHSLLDPLALSLSLLPEFSKEKPITKTAAALLYHQSNSSMLYEFLQIYLQLS